MLKNEKGKEKKEYKQRKNRKENEKGKGNGRKGAGVVKEGVKRNRMEREGKRTPKKYFYWKIC